MRENLASPAVKAPPSRAPASIQRFYSAVNHGFYSSEVHGARVPEDAVPVSEAEWRRLLDGQCQGQEIVADGQGRPTLQARVNSAEQRAAWMRQERNAALAATDALVARHRDEVALARATRLTAQQFEQLLAYRQALRDVPGERGFPEVSLPERPSFL